MDTAFIFPSSDGGGRDSEKISCGIDCKEITRTGDGVVFNGVKNLKIKKRVATLTSQCPRRSEFAGIFPSTEGFRGEI